jgi:hypothetical protein
MVEKLETSKDETQMLRPATNQFKKGATNIAIRTLPRQQWDNGERRLNQTQGEMNEHGSAGWCC